MNLIGTYTAIITPFQADRRFDTKSFEKLLRRQMAAGIDGLVLLGTTGEAPTVPFEEVESIFSYAREIVGESYPLILGLTSNDTQSILKKKDRVQAMRPAAILTAAPYYSKPTQKGLLEHFRIIASTFELPIVLYNVPSRSGVNIAAETIIELSQIENVIGVKEASGNLEQVQAVIEGTHESFSVLSGSDEQNLDIIKLGGKGIISVATNVIPRYMKALIDAALRGDISTAERMNQTAHQFLLDIFIENNPQAIKTLMAHLGHCEEIFRLPMTTMLEENKARLLESWKAMSVSVEDR